MLRKVFAQEGITLEKHDECIKFVDEKPKYDICVDGCLGDVYTGNEYISKLTVYDIHYWPDDNNEVELLHLVDEVETYRSFIQDYFIAVDDILRFDISNDNSIYLDDGKNNYYLNYNTNL